MLRVGLTGGIACGKTAIGEMFVRLGAHLIQADLIAHELMRPGEKVYDELVAHFGPDILNSDGTISRPRLAEAAFSSGGPFKPDFGLSGSENTVPAGVPHPSPPGEGGTGNRVRELNSIVHPAVIKRQEDWMDEVGRSDPNAVAIVEAALIFEAGVERRFDKIIVVACDASKKAERFSQRTGMTAELALQEVERRTAAQIADAEKVSRADYVIYNNGSLQEAESQVEQVWSKLAKLARQNT